VSDTKTVQEVLKVRVATSPKDGVISWTLRELLEYWQHDSQYVEDKIPIESVAHDLHMLGNVLLKE